MSRDMRSANCLIVALVFLYATLNTTVDVKGQSGREITFSNQLDEPISLWFQPEGADRFLRPPVFLGPKPNGEKTVPLSQAHRNKRYIVIRDKANEDTHVGWVDLERIASSKTPVMLVAGVVVVRNCVVPYTVATTVRDEEISPDGQVRWVPRVVTEQRTKTLSVQQRKLKLMVQVGDRWQTVEASRTPSGR